MTITLEDLAIMMKNGFDRSKEDMTERFDAVDQRFDKVETRLSTIEADLITVKASVQSLVADVENIRDRVKSIEEFIQSADQRITASKEDTELALKELGDNKTRLQTLETKLGLKLPMY